MYTYIEYAPTAQRMEFYNSYIASYQAHSWLYKLAIGSYISLFYNGWHYSYARNTYVAIAAY